MVSLTRERSMKALSLAKNVTKALKAEEVLLQIAKILSKIFVLLLKFNKNYSLVASVFKILIYYLKTLNYVTLVF